MTAVDCSGISAAGYELCASSATSCEAVFTDGAGCDVVCAAAGLACETAKENAEAWEEIKKSGKTEIIIPTAAENAAMRKAMEPLYSEMGARVGKQLIEDVTKATHGVTN